MPPSIWFDLDNSPHVPLFRPILQELARREVDCLVTARDHAQTHGLLSLWHIPHHLIGKHGGGNKLWKIVNLFERSSALVSVAKGGSISMAMSHGSRTHLLAAKWLRIPYLWMQDYEFQEKALANLLADYILLPSHIPDSRVISSGYNLRKVIRYNGLKEEIYLKDFVPQPGFRRTIGVDDSTILVVLRPPALTANYHDHRSEELFRRCLDHFAADVNVRCFILPRGIQDRKLIPEQLLARGSIVILDAPVDGLQLLWNADLVVSGGGTMNRESALLGVPTYSIFTGRRPYLDEYLSQNGRLTFIESVHEVETIAVRKRSIGSHFQPRNTTLALEVVDIMMDIAEAKPANG